MKIDAFDEGLEHRNIVPYGPAYARVFAEVKEYVRTHLAGVELVHIGSTAVVGLRGKPMIDITAITSRDDLREEQRAFERIGFHRRPVWVDRDEKPYVCGSVLHEGRCFNVNIHICHRGDPVHKDSLAFIEILSRRPDLRRRYEEAKDRAHAVDPANPQVYNREKEAVIKEIEAQIPKAWAKEACMEVHQIGASELGDLLALYKHLHDADDPLPDAATVEAVWQELLSNPRYKYFGGYVGGKLVASCTLTVVPNLTRGCRPYGVIENVVTHADHRKQGHGKAVLVEALSFAWSQGCYKVMLMTGRKDEATFQFYESAGFNRNDKQAFIAKAPADQGRSIP
jgi:GrpB-like predicted nucleotidyltransferase (UPF0157 family)/GNAT superfamily N-acetyltransferase